MDKCKLWSLTFPGLAIQFAVALVFLIIKTSGLKPKNTKVPSVLLLPWYIPNLENPGTSFQQ